MQPTPQAIARLPHYRRRAALALVAGLLALQALSIGHGFSHPVVKHGHHQCLVCAHGTAVEPGLAPQVPALMLTPKAAKPPAPNTFVTIPAAPPARRSRSPPRLPIA